MSVFSSVPHGDTFQRQLLCALHSEHEIGNEKKNQKQRELFVGNLSTA